MLTGRIAIVTGAGGGLGRAEALELAARGTAVVVADTDAIAAQAVVAEIAASEGAALAAVGDVADAGYVDALINVAVESFGGLHILVNNAGVLNGERSLPDITPAELDRLFAVNVRGYFLTSIAATRYWRERARTTGERVDARIVNTASEAFLHGAPHRVDYAASKAAIITLTVGTAAACSDFGVRANAICPRATTAMTTGLPGFDAAYADGTPRFAPAHVAHFVAGLVGPAGAHLSGHVFVVFGRGFDVLAPPTVASHHECPEGWPASALDEVLTTLGPPGYSTQLYAGLTTATHSDDWAD